MDGGSSNGRKGDEKQPKKRDKLDILKERMKMLGSVLVFFFLQVEKTSVGLQTWVFGKNDTHEEKVS